MEKLIGPFAQILPLTGLPLKGALKDEQLHIIANGGVLVESGLIIAIGSFTELRKANPSTQIEKYKATRYCCPAL
jgi:imidazolonepropionase